MKAGYIALAALIPVVGLTLLNLATYWPVRETWPDYPCQDGMHGSWSTATANTYHDPFWWEQWRASKYGILERRQHIKNCHREYRVTFTTENYEPGSVRAWPPHDASVDTHAKR